MKLNLVLIAFFLFVFIGKQPVQAQGKSARQAKIISDGAAVYQSADFDSPVLTYLSEGKVHDISSIKFNEAFYRIRIKPGQLGYIADTDVVPIGGAKKAAKNSNVQFSEKERNKIKKNKQKPFEWARFVGPQFANIQYREYTMSLRPTESINFYGIKIFGSDALFEGDVVTDTNILLHMGAPKFYEQATGNSGNGWILITNFLMQSVYPQSKDSMTYFGFGPMLKVTNYNLQLGSGASSTRHNLQDINLGVVFNLGLGLRLSDYALRGEVQYYWEKLQYYGLALSAQFPF